ncbi:uncharacterized protein LOC122644120 [Telopea speciosissima]|uniref:uncharacterized protein LOC122644120 n=1 Tax=Telopea speciosissima TaxID=54955 RepID=UPI001CC51C8C|nr:uncharacterized protein LOC122644120 [Telopea speciosissima]
MATARGRRAAMITLARSSISVAILMAFLCPLIQASRPSFHGEREMIEADKASLVSKGPETLLFQMHHQNRGSSSSSVLESERQVPTGPDPLHHNGFPSRP